MAGMLTPSSPHEHSAPAVSVVMLKVLGALIPGVALYVWFFGPVILVHLLIAVGASVLAEAAMLRARGRPVVPFLRDGSAVVTGVLLALAVPPLSPWWTTLLGAVFAIVVAKQLFGGLGYNPFNPAMAGYVMLLVSFPAQMTLWPAAEQATGVMASVGAVFGGGVDGLTGATALDLMKTGLGQGHTVSDTLQGAAVGFAGGAGWEWMALAYGAGGLWLIQQRVIGWHIPVAMLAALALMSAVFNVSDPGFFPSPAFHLLSGGAVLAAFFIATDPVSAAATPRGRLLFGAGIGVITYVIRTWGGYPDGIAFAVLLMNMAVPTIDHYTRPRVFGHGGESS